MNEVEHFFDALEEPNKSVFLFIKNFITQNYSNITLYKKWGLPYLYYKEKPLCYIWKDKKTNEPYLSFAKGSKMNHPALIQGDRKIFKILPINPNKDIDVDLITEILEEALKLY
ncbi:hypothetical protein FHR24_002171 [Wenyingzhuangia heitensis]|uniref:YdhG-like domain-containing protein n=1 Tax=Wenyingzhuangia heitensis TaxID=1487859 RepID=A0ABX0UA59_9FLAO|nr:DUF1801 domain-containing protein [Wenyingzhuangia heitensis]NIJ45703.1 hypothetical protein [Wenyingzhuangia heitensis]